MGVCWRCGEETYTKFEDNINLCASCYLVREKKHGEALHRLYTLDFDKDDVIGVSLAAIAFSLEQIARIGLETWRESAAAETETGNDTGSDDDAARAETEVMGE